MHLGTVMIASSFLFTLSMQCSDTTEMCYYWALSGDCEDLPRWMGQFCPQSCNLCRSFSSPPRTFGWVSVTPRNYDDYDAYENSIEYITPRFVAPEPTNAPVISRFVVSPARFTRSHTPKPSWAEWSNWSSCTLGRQHRRRTCPTTKCLGSSIGHRLCQYNDEKEKSKELFRSK